MRLQTPRLVLRAFEEGDAAALYDITKNPNVCTAAGLKPTASEAEAVHITGLLTREGSGTWAVTLREEGRLVGWVGVQPDGKRGNVPGALSIAYALDEAFWGLGLMPEAVRAFMAHAFAEFDATILSAYHYPFNVQSGRVMQKCGMRHEGMLRMAATMYTGEVMDHVCYSITKEEFLATLG